MADIGVRVGVEGEKEFKSAIKEINSDMKVLASEAGLVASQYDKNDKSAEALAARSKVLNEQISKQKEKVEVLKNALAKSAETFGENDQKTKKWQIQLNNAQKELNNLETEAKQAGNASEKFGDQTKEAADETEKSSNKFSKVGTVMAAAGAAIVAAAAAITKAAVEVGKAMVQMSVDGAAFADTILTESTVTGIATDKLQEYQYAAELIDVSVETLTGSMKKNIMSMRNAAQGTKQYADVYDKLGIAITDSNGELRDSETVYWELIDALGKVDNETERDAMALTILGKSAQDLNPLIEAGAERMEELGQAAHDAGYVMSDEALNSFGALDDQIQYLTVGCTAAKNAIGTVLLPVLTDLATEGVSLLGEFTNGILDANGNIDKMANVVSTMIPEVMNAAMKYFPEIIALVGTIVSSLLTAITDNAPLIFQTVVDLAFELIQSLTDLLPGILKAAISLVKDLLMAIANNLPDLLIQVTDAIIDFFAGDGLTELLNGIFSAIAKILARLPEIIVKIVSTIPIVIKAVVEALLENLPILIEGVLTLVTSLIAYTPEIIVEILKIMPTLIQGIAEGVVKMGAQFGKIGKGMIDGIWSGIKGAWDSLKKNVLGLFKTLGDGICNFLGIHSPSTVYAQIGGYMAEGLGIGFEKEMVAVENSIQSSIPTFDIAGTSRMASAITGQSSAVSLAGKVGAANYESMEQTDLLKEQNELLRALLEKSLNVEISNRQIGNANKVYTNNRGMVLNGGMA